MATNTGKIILVQPDESYDQNWWTNIFTEAFTRANGVPGNNWTVYDVLTAGGYIETWQIKSNELIASCLGGGTSSYSSWLYRNNEFGTFAPPYRVRLKMKMNAFTQLYTYPFVIFIGMGNDATSEKTGVKLTCKHQTGWLNMYSLQVDIYNNGSIVETGNLYYGSYDPSTSYFYPEILFSDDKIAITITDWPYSGTVAYEGTITYPSNYFNFYYANQSVNGENRYLYIDDITIDQQN